MFMISEQNYLALSKVQLERIPNTKRFQAQLQQWNRRINKVPALHFRAQISYRPFLLTNGGSTAEQRPQNSWVAHRTQRGQPHMLLSVVLPAQKRSPCGLSPLQIRATISLAFTFSSEKGQTSCMLKNRTFKKDIFPFFDDQFILFFQLPDLLLKRFLLSLESFFCHLLFLAHSARKKENACENETECVPMAVAHQNQASSRGMLTSFKGFFRDTLRIFSFF